MSTYPFTPKGVNDRLDDLYLLSDEDLALEADAIRSDFRDWMVTNFIFDTTQLAFLNGMNNNVVNYYGEQCSICFLYRLPIILDMPPPVPSYSKWTGSRNDFLMETDGNGNEVVTGSLTFTISYR